MRILAGYSKGSAESWIVFANKVSTIKYISEITAEQLSRQTFHIDNYYYGQVRINVTRHSKYYATN